MNSLNPTQVTPATVTINLRFIPTTEGNDASEFVCVSCQEISCNNRLYELGCGHGKLCGNCHDVVCTQQPTCPDQTTRECDESVREKLGKLQVVCQYSVPQQGHDACTWSGHLSEWKAHVLKCNHRLTEPSKCSTKSEAPAQGKPVEGAKHYECHLVENGLDCIAGKMTLEESKEHPRGCVAQHIDYLVNERAKDKEEIEQLKDKVAHQEEKINWLMDTLAQVREILDLGYSNSDGSVVSVHPSDSRSVRSSVDMSGTPGLLPSIPPPPPSVTALSDSPSLSDDSYKTLLCMYWFANAPCPFGDECPCIHGEPELLNRQSYEEWDAPKRKSPPTNVSKEKVICPYFLKGECRYGDHCWYSHKKVRKEENEPLDDEKMPELVEMETDKSPALKSTKLWSCGENEPIDANRIMTTLVPVSAPPPQI